MNFKLSYAASGVSGSSHLQSFTDGDGKCAMFRRIFTRLQVFLLHQLSTQLSSCLKWRIDRYALSLRHDESLASDSGQDPYYRRNSESTDNGFLPRDKWKEWNPFADQPFGGDYIVIEDQALPP